MSEKSEVFLVVIDPAHEQHVALERALVSASMRDNAPHIHLFISLDVELMSRAERAEGRGMSSEQLDAITLRLKESGVSYSYEFYWSRDIESSILKSAEYVAASMILYPLTGKAVQKHMWFTNAKWELLRNSKCPVMLLSPEKIGKPQVILAAVNFQSPFPEYVELNKRILSRGHWLTEKLGADFHVINTYEDMSDYPDVEKIKTLSQLDQDHIHVVETGRLEKTVAEMTEKLNADVVLIGIRNTRDNLSKFRHNTAEKVVNSLDTDILVVT